jgi:transposase InsO family protein
MTCDNVSAYCVQHSPSRGLVAARLDHCLPRCAAFSLPTTSIFPPRAPRPAPNASRGPTGSSTGPGSHRAGASPFLATNFSRCRAAPNCFAIIDLASRKWTATLLSPAGTALQTQVEFLQALEAEGLLDTVENRLNTSELPTGDQIPILLAVSDNGPPMTAADTRSLMAQCSIAQHFGRPGVPTDQAPIENFFGHIKASDPSGRAHPSPEVNRWIEAECLMWWAAMGPKVPLETRSGHRDG